MIWPNWKSEGIITSGRIFVETATMDPNFNPPSASMNPDATVPAVTAGADVWVVTRTDEEEREFGVVAVTETLDAARQAATDDLDPDWPTLEWVQQPDGTWTTYVVQSIRYTAEQYEVIR